MKVVVHNGFTCGGLAEYSVNQVNAMVEAGCQVVYLVPREFSRSVSNDVEVKRVVPDLGAAKTTSIRILQRLYWVNRVLKTWTLIARELLKVKPDALLISAFSEYLAPLWSWRLKRVRKRMPDLILSTVVHDPVRSVVGFQWWHRLSLREAYSFLDTAFVHKSVPELKRYADMCGFNILEVPHGVRPSRSEVVPQLKEWNEAPERTRTILAFGHIRDSKNLDLMISAMADFPELRLLVAGSVVSGRDRPVSYYVDQASRLGLDERIELRDKFIPDKEVDDLFAAADYILLSYDRHFASASGVMHLAISHRKPVLATSGDGHLKWAVETYNLGVWCKPDCSRAIEEGLRKLLELTPGESRGWEDYEAENTWEKNVEIILESLSRRDKVGANSLEAHPMKQSGLGPLSVTQE